MQLKQRKRDFLPWKLYLFWIYTNYLLTFDQQLLEHLFQVLQEKKIILKSAVEVHTRWQGMTISHFSHYVLGLKNKRLSIISLQAKQANVSNKVPHQPSALSDYGLHQLRQREVKRNPAEENCRETSWQGLQSSPFFNFYFRQFITSKLLGFISFKP